VMISHPPPTIEHPQSINNFCGGSERYTAMYCIVLFLNQVLPGQSLQSVLVYNLQICMQCLTDLIFLLVAVVSI